MKFNITQESLPDLSRLYPVTTDEEGTVLHGRPDASKLIGFQERDVQRVKVFVWDAVKAPESVIGLCPVFVGLEGGMFAVETPVQSAYLSEV